MSDPTGSGRVDLPPSARAYLDTMTRRFACKLFDGRRALEPELVEYVLECGRLSPSSFGLEHWRFIAVVDPFLKGSLFTACFEQDAVQSAALAVAILVRKAAAYEPHSAFIRSRVERFPGGWPVFYDDYRGYYEYLFENRLLDHWARAQSYIACANMMTGAAAAGIDSCAIEGFHEPTVLTALDEDPDTWTVGLLVVFGYAAEAVRGKIREPLSSISEIR